MVAVVSWNQGSVMKEATANKEVESYLWLNFLLPR